MIFLQHLACQHLFIFKSMSFIFIAFISSLLINYLLIKYQHYHEKISGDHNLTGPQKFHKIAVPRIGGISICIAIFVSATTINIFSANQNILIKIIILAIPAFAVGLLEDFTKKMSIKSRLIGCAFSAILFGYFLNTWITIIHVPIIDWALNTFIVSVVLTTVAIVGLTNAYNIIDGFNGLASMTGIIVLVAIAFVAFITSDASLAYACVISAASIGGFFIWNYPKGLIFLGDGGAFLIGFLIASFSILLITRNESISPWFALLANAYPVFETLFSIWRRKIHQNKNPGLPDATHFHSLIYRRILRWKKQNELNDLFAYRKNAKTSQILWLISSLPVIVAIIWHKNTIILQLFSLLYLISYIWMYKRIIQFKTPSFLKNL